VSGIDYKPLRVVTWNIWWRHGPWEQRHDAIVTTLKQVDADVIFLQEVWAETDGRNQAAELADELQFHYTYATGSEAGDGLEIGNAILSRWPLTDVGSLELPMSTVSPERRCAVHAIVEAPFASIPTVTAHLTWQRNNSKGRRNQVDAILELIDKISHSEWPPILGGDFNADPDSDEIRMITGKSVDSHERLVFQDVWVNAGDGSPGVTWTPNSQHFAASRFREMTAMPWLSRRLDYLFVGLPDGRPTPTLAVQAEKAWLVGKGETEAEEGSDHYAVVVDLRPQRLG
jgi:endonuclease/exonuclease/phosphatase family metal-dependent hydrolase